MRGLLPNSSLSTDKRAKIFSDLGHDFFDIVVVGGGIAGSGIVRDASLRGLKCLLVEKKDFASGTSSKSGKLIHGGLRYLRYGHFRLVWEACNERLNLLRIVAPHLVKPTQFIIPFYKHSRTPRWLAAMGLFVYGMLSLFRNVRRFQFLSKQELEQAEPHLRRSGVVGGLSYTDCVAMDSRLTMDTLKSAVGLGAIVLNYCELNQLQFGPEGVIVAVKDVLRGQSHMAKARVVINAAGAWADDVLMKAGSRDIFHMKHSCGIHLVFHRKKLPVSHTLGVEAVSDARNIYIIPFGEYVLVGTTDVFYEGSKDKLLITEQAAQYLIDSVNYYYPESKLGFKDVVSATCGIRPLMGGRTGQREEEVSRDYAILVDKRGLVSVSGGKLTTYRSMSEKVVNQVVRHFFKRRRLKKCRTRSPISGVMTAHPDISMLAKELHLETSVIQSLVERYGSNYIYMADTIRIRPDTGRAISKSCPYLWAEIDYFVDQEWVEKLSDVLMRRTQIFLFSEDRGLSVCESIAEYIGKLKHWSKDRIEHEVKEYRDEAQIHF